MLDCFKFQAFPTFKKHFLTIGLHLHHIQPLHSPPVSHHPLPRPSLLPHSLFFPCLLFFGRSFGVAQVTWPKPSKRLKRYQDCLFSFPPSFLLILTPFTLPPVSPQILILSSVSTFFCSPSLFSLLYLQTQSPENCQDALSKKRIQQWAERHTRIEFMLVIIRWVFWEITRATSVWTDRAREPNMPPFLCDERLVRLK